MKIQPVKEYKVPKYPDKTVVYSNPNLLKTIPERWKGNVCIGIALSSLIMMMFTACGKTQNQPQDTKNNGTNLNTRGHREAVVPLFMHGDGQGSFGCSSVAPPAFLSEEEAFQVVQEEAGNFNLEFKNKAKTFENVEIPITDIYADYSNTKQDEASKLLSAKKGELKLDGYNEEIHIGFEFVSKDDFVSWHKKKGMVSSVETYDLIPAAETLRKGLEGNTQGNIIGVFYDPITRSENIIKHYNEKFRQLNENKSLTEEQRNSEWQKLHESYQEELKQSVKDELRKQIKDFLNWLKAEEII